MSDKPELAGRKLLAAGRAFARRIKAGVGTRHRRAIGWLLALAMIAWLVFRLQRIGWAQVWDARPTAPAFYLLVLLAYLTLPVADTLIYRRLWKIRFWSSLSAFMRKRIYNSSLVGYSGELFLLLWARDRLRLSNGEIAHAIKDTNILSAVVSTYVSAGLIVYVLSHAALRHLAAGAFGFWAGATVLIAALAPIAFIFRRHFMVLTARTALFVLGVHAARFVIGQLFILAQWHVVMPGIGLNTLVTLLAVQMLINRIPFLPNRDLLFIGIGIELSGVLALPQARLASLLVATSALQQALHLAVILATSARMAGSRR